jgi:hypothetical protein
MNGEEWIQLAHDKNQCTVLTTTDSSNSLTLWKLIDYLSN